MPVWSIILLAFIYGGALAFSLWKNFLPRSFTLFGVKYGDKFRDMDNMLKLKVILVHTATVVFSAANVLVPLKMLDTYHRTMHVLWFWVVYLACLIVWLVVLTRTSIAKKYYEPEIRRILDNTPLFTAVVNYLRNSRLDRNGNKMSGHRYLAVISCTDGIALFTRPIQSYSITHDVGGTSKSGCRAARDAWQRATEHEWSSIYTMRAPAAVFPATDYLYPELTSKDQKDFCYYLAREEDLDLEYQELSFTEEFECSYTVVTTYDDGSTDRDYKNKSASGSVFVHAAIATEPKAPKKRKVAEAKLPVAQPTPPAPQPQRDTMPRQEHKPTLGVDAIKNSQKQASKKP